MLSIFIMWFFLTVADFFIVVALFDRDYEFVGALFLLIGLLSTIFLLAFTFGFPDHSDKIEYTHSQFKYTQTVNQTAILFEDGGSMVTTQAGFYNIIHDSSAVIIKEQPYSVVGISLEPKYIITVKK
jgi:hypothetical protein